GCGEWGGGGSGWLAGAGVRKGVLGIGASEGRAGSWNVAGRPSGFPTLQERRVPGGAAPTRCGWVGREPRWAAGRLLILLLNRGRVGGAAHHVLVLGRRLLLGAGSLGHRRRHRRHRRGGGGCGRGPGWALPRGAP